MNSQEVVLSLEDGVRTIRINRPKSRNAFNSAVYRALAETLNADAGDDSVVATIITGTGEYYSSGFDIKSAAASFSDDEKRGVDELRATIKAFISYPKLLIALVNGPAIGVAVTTAALCDVVYASDRATFETPFVRVGVCAEGCSSYTLPRALGRSKASEMLLLGRRLSAEEACQFGLAARVVPHRELEEFSRELKGSLRKLSVNSVVVNKRLIMSNYESKLCQCCERELQQLTECFKSDEFSQAIISFMTRKSKL